MRLPRLVLVLVALLLPVLRLAAQRGPNGPSGTGPAQPTPPMPYVTTRALGGLRFDQPLGIVSAPGETNRLFILEKTGRMQVIADVTKPEKKVFLDLTAEIGNLDVERGLLSVAFHPDYKKNHYFYVWLTATNATGSFDRLSRFTTSATDPDQADPKSEQILISQIDRAPNHNGGELHFGPDGYLYLTIGDEGGGNDQFHNSQLIDHNFFSCMLRIDVDQRPGSLKPNPNPAVQPDTYTVPPDNPFVGATTFDSLPVDPAKVRTEFWAVGLRNAWRYSFDPMTGLIWLGDVGQDRVEEVDIIKKGGNYGWNYREGNEAFQVRGQTVRLPPTGVTFDEPLFTYRHPNVPGVTADSGNCITGGLVYRGDALPALKGRYLFTDYVSGWIWALSPVDGKGGKVTGEKIAREKGGGIVAFYQDPRTGDLLVANIAPNSGYIERLVPAPAAAPNALPPAAPAAK